MTHAKKFFNWRTIGLGTLVSGILDAAAGVIVYFLMFGFNPIQVLQSISEGIQGPRAFSGGLASAFAGLLLHFFIAFVCTMVFYGAYRKLKFLHRRTALYGVLFGAFVWAIMNMIVIPHSSIPPQPFNGPLAAISLLWHMLLVGLPISLIIKKQLKNTNL